MFSALKKSICLTLIGMSLGANEIPLDTLTNIPLLKRPNLTLVKAEDKGALYIIDAKAETPQGVMKVQIFVTKDKKTVLFGDAFDAQTGEPIMMAINMKAYESQAAFRYGRGEKTYYIFTDPECPYCKKFENSFEKLATKARLVVFLYPLPHHQQAKAMSFHILSGETDKERFERIIASAKVGFTFKKESQYTKTDKEKLEKLLNAQESVVKEMGVNATPSVFDEQGRPVSWPDLVK